MEKTKTHFKKNENFEDYFQKLNTHKQTCDVLKNSINQLKNTTNNIESTYNQMMETMDEYKDCEILFFEIKKLSKINEEIESKLVHFDINSIENDLNVEYIESKGYIKALNRLDEAIRFLNNYSEYHESKKYLTKYNELLTKCLNDMRNYILTNLNFETEKILNEIFEEKKKGVELQETSLLYIKFRISIEKLKPILNEINKKSKNKNFQIFLMDCYECYYEKRNSLLYEIISEKLKFLIKEENLTNLVRIGCSYLIQTYVQEIQLFENFFKNENLEIISLLGIYSNFLYEGLRSLVLKVNDINILCDIILILRNEILIEAIKPREKFLFSFSKTVHRMQQDVQERLIFKSFSFIQEKITGFIPKEEHLNYPMKLKESIKTEEEEEMEEEVENMLYPTLLKTIKLLNKLYLCLDKGVFEGIAQTSCMECISTLKKASDKIKQKQGYIDGQLFLLKNLFAFREQLTQFDVSFTETNYTLDFSHIIPGVSKFLQGKASVKISNLFFDIFSQSSPRILVQSNDSKKSLDDEINSACETFILNITRLSLDPIILLLKKSSIDQENEKPSVNQMLDDFEKIKISLNDVLQELKEKIHLYIKNTSNLHNLITPIKGSLVVTYEQFLDLISKSFDETNQQKIREKVFIIDEFKEILEKELKFFNPNDIAL
eukprot:gene7241-11559_t